MNTSNITNDEINFLQGLVPNNKFIGLDWWKDIHKETIMEYIKEVKDIINKVVKCYKENKKWIHKVEAVCYNGNGYITAQTLIVNMNRKKEFTITIYLPAKDITIHIKYDK